MVVVPAGLDAGREMTWIAGPSVLIGALSGGRIDSSRTSGGVTRRRNVHVVLCAHMRLIYVVVCNKKGCKTRMLSMLMGKVLEQGGVQR